MTAEHRAILDRIVSSAGAVKRAAAAVRPGQEARAPAPGEWSARETLVHLRAAVMLAYGLRIRRLLYETDPSFADFDEETYRRAVMAGGETAPELAAAVVAEHEQVVRLLRDLPDDAWSRQGRHPTYGLLSVERLARGIAEHAEEHAAQLAAIAERQR